MKFIKFYIQISLSIRSSLCPVIGYIQVSMTMHRKQPWKRCAAHVHISCLIRDLQNSERKEWLVQPNQLRIDERSKQVVPLPGNNPSGPRNGSSGVASAKSPGDSAVEKNSIEARKGVFLQQGFHQDQHRAPASGTCTSQMQVISILKALTVLSFPLI